MSKYAHYSKPDPEFAVVEEAVKNGSDMLFSLPLEQMKVVFGGPDTPRPADMPHDDEMKIENVKVPVRDGTKVDLQIYKSKANDNPKSPLVFAMHGGGWVIGTHGAEEPMNRYLAVRNGAVVVSVDYRMAPEFTFPYAVTDSFDALKWCKENADSLGADPNLIVLAGASAGGNLALVLAQMARDEKIGGIVGQLVNIPVTCHPDFFPKDRFEYESYEQNAENSTLTKARMDWFWGHYLPKPTPDPRHSPLLTEDLSNLPPALLQIAGQDPLRDEGIAYADRLKDAGVPVQLEVYTGLPHGFGSAPIAAGKKYFDNMVAFVDRTVKDAKSR